MFLGVPTLVVILPNWIPDAKLEFGLPKLGWFSRLKNSARNKRFCSLAMFVDLVNAKSMLVSRGPRSVLIPVFPKVPTVFGWKAVVLNHRANLAVIGRS